MYDLLLQSIISFPPTCHPDLASGLVGLDVPAKFACPAYQKIVATQLVETISALAFWLQQHSNFALGTRFKQCH